MISNIGANLLSNGFPQMSPKERNGSLGSPSSQKPDLIHSLVSGVGPLLMASVVGGGLSSKNRNNGSPTSSEAKSPMQSILSGLGPALIGGTVQNLLGNSNSGSGGLHSERSPVQSVISGLAPVLLAGALGQGYSAEGRSNSKTFEGDSAGPLQSLMSGLGPAVLKAVGQGLGAGFSETDPAKGASSLGGLISNMAPMLIGGGISTRAKQKSNSVNSYSNSPPHETVRERNVSKTDDPTSVNGDSTAPPPGGTAVSGEATPLGRSLPGLSMDGMLMKSVARAAFARLLPDRISVPEVNSTRGLWHMAVNLALGNPRQESGRKGGWKWAKTGNVLPSPTTENGRNRYQNEKPWFIHLSHTKDFWNWLREYGGIDGTSDAETPPSWITKCLESPERLQYAEEVKKLHWTMTQPQPLCQRLEMIGGVFNWKVNLMEDERAVCLDNDVAPQKTDCLVYNFGRVTEWILEEALESIGCEVYVFDPTDEKGNHNHTRGIHFYSVGLSDVNAIRKVDGQVLRLFTLSSILDHFGHETTPIAYMRLGIGKRRVEGSSASSRRHSSGDTNVKQLSLEINLELALRDPSLYKKYVDLLEVLESLGFQLFFSKPVQNQENVSFLDPLVGEEVSLGYQMVFLRI
ncbi:LOW QUALITY PROTEIN: uncharacterized protein LOC135199701 [Macrobrachium nipponense]|uniref:LOW QUALITY PROTEIN: uncharacterized protein LOC135199701 n=1 Tax=Macrobrachium nipponense TaxID=159736 RepID=UPI0030C88E33